MRRLLLSSLLMAGCADGGGAGSPASPTPAGAGSTTAQAESTGDESGAVISSSDSTQGSETTVTSGSGVECGPGLVACGVSCADVQSDPDNCGACGVSCVVPNAASVCESGACTVGACMPTWFDCDANPNNGCESQQSCVPGARCTTTCGSTGSTRCNGCAEVCEVPVEQCNVIDDDCNGSCDEGEIAGCREPVHRANGPNGHYYTNVLAETSQEGRSLESQNYWWLYTQRHAGLTALYRCDLGGGRFFLTTNAGCEGAGSIDDTLGFLSPGPACGSSPLYRLRSPAGRHFYTISATERDNAVENLGFVSEGSPGHVWTSG